jgi:hypothetical protein
MRQDAGMRHPPPSPEFDHVRVRLETALAPIRTRISRARERMAAQRQRPGPDPEVLAWAAQSQHAPADLAAVAQAVREGRTTWEKVAAGEADDLPEMKRFYSASLARSRRLIERWHEPAGGHERKEDADE